MKYTLQLLGAAVCVLIARPVLSQVNAACVSACIAETCTAADFANAAHQAACVNSARPVCEGECASPKPPPSPPPVPTIPLQVILQFDQLLKDEARVAPMARMGQVDFSKGHGELEAGSAMTNKAIADGKVAERMAAVSVAEAAGGRAEFARGQADMHRGILEIREAARLRHEIDQLRATLIKACGAPAGASDDQLRSACKIPAK